jgi:nucleoside 2-deoxyribosyltransferase
MPPRVYLAGPDVFLPDAAERADALKRVCARHGLIGVSPLDAFADAPAEWAALSESARIHRRNEAHMRGCAALIANLTPFRGPSADVGTAYEIGFMRALGRPVFGYATTARRFAERTLTWIGAAAIRDNAGNWRDAAGMSVEDFGLFDNLMLDGAISASGGLLVVAERPEARWADVTLFEGCVRAAAELLHGAGASLTTP